MTLANRVVAMNEGRIEPIGDATLLTFQVGDPRMVAKLSKDFSARSGDAIKLAISGKYCLFDSTSGKILTE